MRLYSWLTVLMVLSAPLVAQDLDQLFEEPPGDIATAPPTPQAAEVPSPIIRVGGKVDFEGAVLAGAKQWGGPISGSAFYTMEGSLILDARPDPDFRVWMDLGTESTGAAFSTPAIQELFFDYTLADLIVFRVGKQVMTWGQGRLFNPADFMSDAEDSIGFKVFAPVFGQGLTLVSLVNPAHTADPRAPSWRELSYAALLSGDLGPLGWGFAGRVRPGVELSWPEQWVSAFAKFAVAGVDTFGEWMWVDGSWNYLVGFFWEQRDPRLKIQAEASVDRLGLAVKLNLGPVSPGLQWTQFFDESGILTAGVEWPIDGKTVLTVGFPVVYGPENGLAMSENEDPEKRRWVSGVKVTLEKSF